jgi:uncharacterized protein (DUF2062 family)
MTIALHPKKNGILPRFQGGIDRMFDEALKTDEKKPRGKVNQWLRKLFRWLLTLRGSPESIGLGVAIGIFVACSPLLGIHLVMAVVLATLLGANRPAALATSFLNNPATFVPVYAMEYWVGSFFWSGPPVARVKQVLAEVLDQFTGSSVLNMREHAALVLELGKDVFIPMMIGGTLMGLVAGTAVYFPAVALVRKLRGKREKRQARREE